MVLKKNRRLWPIVAAAVAVNAAGIYALTSTIDVRAALTTSQSALQWDTAPTGPQAPAAPAPPSGPQTPATAFIETMAAQEPDVLFGAGATTTTRTTSDPTTPACLAWPEGTTSLSLTPTRTGNSGITTQILTTPAGAGTATVDTWRKALAGCSGARAVPAHRTAVPDGAQGFTAQLSPAGKSAILTQAVWARGDVVTIVTYAPGRESFSSVTGDDLAQMRAVTASLDSALVTHLTPVCADLNPSVDDALRNPNRAGYVPYAREVTVPVLAAPPVERPPAPAPMQAISVPTKKEFVDLAPLAPLTAADWVDSNADGVVDQRPALSEARRLPPPSLIDPTAFSTTGLASDPGPAPSEPAPGPTTITYKQPVADPAGPGCGWSFTGAKGPADDPAALQAKGASARAKALATSSEATAEAWLARLDWTAAWAAWAQKDAEYAPVRAYLAARSSAVAAHQKAVETYAASVRAFESAAPPAPEPERPEPPNRPGGDKPTPPTVPPNPRPEEPAPSPSPAPTPTAPPSSNPDRPNSEGTT